MRYGCPCLRLCVPASISGYWQSPQLSWVFINSYGLSHYKCKASYTHVSAVVAVRTWPIPVDGNRWVPVVRTSISVIPGKVLLLKA